MKLQADLQNLSVWLLNHKLALNVTKTKSMLITPKNTVHCEDINLTLNNELIENVEVFKFLGIWIDHHLEWNHWRIQGGRRWRPPNRINFFHFRMFSPKSVCIGGQRPPIGRRPPPPQWEILDPPLGTTIC